MFKKNIKGITAIISLSLLIVISLIGYFMVSNDTLFVLDSLEVQLQQKDLSGSLEILKIENETLYLQNDLSDNLVLNSIKIGQIQCDISSSTLTLGSNEVDISDCTSSLSELSVQDVSLSTDYGIFQESELLRTVSEAEEVIS
jgi:hypothetical protein